MLSEAIAVHVIVQSLYLINHSGIFKPIYVKFTMSQSSKKSIRDRFVHIFPTKYKSINQLNFLEKARNYLLYKTRTVQETNPERKILFTSNPV